MINLNDKNEFLKKVRNGIPSASANDCQKFKDCYSKENLKRAGQLNILVLLLTGILLVIDIVFTPFKGYLTYDVFAFSASVLFLIISRLPKSIKPLNSLVFNNIYILFLQTSLIWASLISLTEISSGSGGFETYIIVSISIASIFTFNSKQFSIVFAPSIITLLLATYLNQNITPTELLTKHFAIFSLIPILWAISRLMYKTKHKELQSRRDSMEIQELLKHEIQERVASEASLKSLTGKLETLVAQRTKNLEQTNNELQKEILERKAIELENFESKKQLQEQNLALRKVNDELDMFVYRTSHDLRAPLSSLLGLINISRGEYNSEESLGYYLDLMQKSVNKLDNYISDILDYSQNTRLRVRKNEINFHTLIEEILDGQKYQDPFQQVEIELDIQHPTAFFTDQKRLQIILNNIVSNAFRFRKTNEPHQKIQIKFHVKNNTAFIEISDNGQGIEQNRINKIFEMFYRGAENSKGSGLGLYIVKEAVNKIGGTIAVDSEVNHGSTFKLEIPSQKKVKAKAAVPA